MKTVAVASLMLLASTAFAAPVGTGNFRRADAVKAARAQSQFTYVRGLAKMEPKLNPKSSRILFVRNGDTKKVSIVKAPVDKSQPVRVLTARQANKLGLLTQSQARQLASSNGGVYGSRSKVKLQDRGVTYNGKSYTFKQTSPMGWTIPLYKYDGKQVYGRVKSVDRSVPVTGQAGESASGWAQTLK